MDKNVLVLIGSPRTKESNSEVISNELINKLSSKDINCTRLYLENLAKGQEGVLEDNINKAEVIILAAPVYENSVPSIVLKAFELLHENKNKITSQNRSMLVIANSGFCDTEGCKNLIAACSLFSKAMSFQWLGGITVVPGTLIEGGKLGKTYKNLAKALDFIAEDIYMGRKLSEEAFKLTSKPVINPFIYRVAGRIIQNKVIKKLGKDNFYARPLKS